LPPRSKPRFPVLDAVDSIRVVNVLSARYRDPGLLGERIGAANSALYSPVAATCRSRWSTKPA